jgi:hypothetical protein
MGIGMDFLLKTFITGFDERVSDKKRLDETVKLPEPETKGGPSKWDCLRERR